MASLLIRFPGKRMATLRDFNARITRRGPWAHEPNLERSYVVRNIRESRTQRNPPAEPRCRDAQRVGEINQRELVCIISLSNGARVRRRCRQRLGSLKIRQEV